jgi:omega-6 fatty acid desaturase (delta-12 desaturase)
VIPYAVGWLLMAYSLRYGYWLTCLLAVPTAGFFIRLFMIQHDCGHGSFFPSRKANDALGFVLGVVTFTPYQYWRKTHAIHHATSGDLNRRGLGDITTLTIKEYAELSKTRQWLYRAYRHPLIMFGLGVFWQFLVKHRFPWNIPSHWKREWRSVHLTNLMLALIISVMIFTMGLTSFLMIFLPVMLIASSCGAWLFYVQHQFEDTYWCQNDQWDFHQAGLQGSSYYELPRILQWFTANIGFHHIHHFSLRVPNYRLEACFKNIVELQQATRVTLGQSWRLASLKLWDEDQQKLVGFKGRVWTC